MKSFGAEGCVQEGLKHLSYDPKAEPAAIRGQRLTLPLNLQDLSCSVLLSKLEMSYPTVNVIIRRAAPPKPEP